MGWVGRIISEIGFHLEWNEEAKWGSGPGVVRVGEIGERRKEKGERREET